MKALWHRYIELTRDGKSTKSLDLLRWNVLYYLQGRQDETAIGVLGHYLIRLHTAIGGILAILNKYTGMLIETWENRKPNSTWMFLTRFRSSTLCSLCTTVQIIFRDSKRPAPLIGISLEDISGPYINLITRLVQFNDFREKQNNANNICPHETYCRIRPISTVE